MTITRLIVSDSSFAYTEALLRKHPSLARHTLATDSSESRDDCVYCAAQRQELDDCFPGADQRCDSCIERANRIDALRKSARVRFNVHPTELEKQFSPGTVFTHIHWNFPHDGHSYQARTLPAFIARFFASSSCLQQVGGRVHLALAQSTHSQLPQEIQAAWRQGFCYGIVQAASTQGYRLKRKRHFKDRFEKYGYTSIENSKGQPIAAADHFAREFVFEKVSPDLSQTALLQAKNLATVATCLGVFGDKKYSIGTLTQDGEEQLYYQCSTDEASSNYSECSEAETELCSYRYAVGASFHPNREIRFLRRGEKAESIHAKVCAEDTEIADLGEGQLLVDTETWQTAMRKQREAAAQGIQWKATLPRPCSELSLSQQNTIFRKLETRDGCTINASMGTGGQYPQFGTVEELTLVVPES